VQRILIIGTKTPLVRLQNMSIVDVAYRFQTYICSVQY